MLVDWLTFLEAEKRNIETRVKVPHSLITRSGLAERRQRTKVPYLNSSLPTHLPETFFPHLHPSLTGCQTGPAPR